MLKLVFYTYHSLPFLFFFYFKSMVLVLYLDVCNEVLFVYDQPVELVFQRRRSLDYGSAIMRGKTELSNCA